MKRSEDIRMPLHIGAERLYVTVPYDRQEFARDVEREIDGLYTKWRREFTAKSDQEILAMVLYQYASFYRELRARFSEASSVAEECLSMLEDWENTQRPESEKEEEPGDFRDFRLESGDF